MLFSIFYQVIGSINSQQNKLKPLQELESEMNDPQYSEDEAQYNDKNINYIYDRLIELSMSLSINNYYYHCFNDFQSLWKTSDSACWHFDNY